MLRIAVTARNPPIPTIILFLKEQATHPQIFSDSALPIETIFLLLEINTTFGFLEESESPQRGRIIGRDVKISQFFFAIFSFLPFFDAFRRVDRTSSRILVLSVNVDEKRRY